MDYRKGEAHKILFSMYCMFCLVLVLFMNFSYGYNEMVPMPPGRDGEVILNQTFSEVSLRALLFTNDTLVLDLTTAEIRENLPIPTILIWISISLIIVAIILIILDVLKDNKHLSFIAAISMLVSFLLFLVIPSFFHRDVTGMGAARFLLYPTIPVFVGIFSSVVVAIIEGRECFLKR